MTLEPAPELIEFLQPYSPEVQELFLATRELVARHSADATETVWDAISAVATGPTYTHNHSKGFIHIAAYTAYVNLGFNWGVNLEDPQQRLKGNGNQIRHISIKKLSDLEDPYIMFLVEQAEAKAFRPNPPMETKTIINVMNGTKRRPSIKSI